MKKKIALLWMFLLKVSTSFASELLLSHQVQLFDGTFIDLDARYFNRCQTLCDVTSDTGNQETSIPLLDRCITRQAITDVQTLMDQETRSSLAQCVGALPSVRLARAALTADYLGVEPWKGSDESSLDPIDEILELFAHKILEEKPVKTWADRFVKSWFWNQEAQFNKAVRLIASSRVLDNKVARKIIPQIPFIPTLIISNAVFDRFLLTHARFSNNNSELTTWFMFSKKSRCAVFDIKTGEFKGVTEYIPLPPYNPDDLLLAKVGRYSGDNLPSPYKGSSLMVVPREGGFLEIFDSRGEQPVPVQKLEQPEIALGKSQLSDDQLSLVSIAFTTSTRAPILSVWQRGKKALESKGGDLEAVTITQAAALYQAAFCT